MKRYLVKMLPLVHLCVWVSACLLLAAGPSQAVLIDGFSSDSNDRFANSSSFTADGYDLSGVALSNDSKWLTMVSPNVYLSANHFKPGIGASVTFYGSNDPLGGSVVRTVTNNRERILSSDLWIGTLDSPLPSGYGYYSFATEDITTGTGNGQGSFNASPYAGENAFIFGRSPNNFAISKDMSVGRNRLDLWWDVVSVKGTVDSAIGSLVDESDDPNYVQHEAYLQPGDSGGPMFVDIGGNLRLVGINWFIDDDPASDFNGQSYVGNYDGVIQEFIEANPIPEPSAQALLASALLLAACGTRSRPSRM